MTAALMRFKDLHPGLLATFPLLSHCTKRKFNKSVEIKDKKYTLAQLNISIKKFISKLKQNKKIKKLYARI